MRREIRSLRSDDLDAFLDASHVLWELGDADGKQKFGEDFKSPNAATFTTTAAHPAVEAVCLGSEVKKSKDS